MELNELFEPTTDETSLTYLADTKSSEGTKRTYLFFVS